MNNEPTATSTSQAYQKFCLDDSIALPTITKVSDAFGPISVFRGRENWLMRVNSDDPATLVQEAKALIARWLKMQNVCVLSGAGMSFCAGGSLGSGLFDRTQALLKDTDTETVLQKAIELAEKPSEVAIDFEAFLSQLTALAALGTTQTPLNKIAEHVEIKQLFGDLKQLSNLIRYIEASISIVCSLELPPSPLMLDDAPLSAHEVFVSKLVARDPQQGRARLFTTNYDTLLEQAMDRLGIFYCDGFSGTVNRRFNPAAYDIDLHYPGDTTEGRVRKYDKVLQLYKLHGSVTWMRSVPSTLEPFGISCRSRSVPSYESIVNSSSEQRISTLAGLYPSNCGLAILPTANKYGMSLTMPYAHLFRSLGHALRQPQTVLFSIGYSGSDGHVNQLVEDALSNPGFTCVLIDPLPSEWARRLLAADYSGRVYCFAGDWGRFETFAISLMPDLDILETDLQIAKTLRNLQRTSSTAGKSEDAHNG
jgi:NAD-dependent SIR2 family protein deacetylase